MSHFNQTKKKAIMENNLKLKMKMRLYSVEKLQAVIDNEDSTEAEVAVAEELLKRKTGGDEAAPVSKKKEVEKEVVKGKKTAPKKAKEEPEEVEEEEPEKETESEDEEQLTDEEKTRLNKAEKQFDERQKNRKTPSKSDKKMDKTEKKEKVHRETKRENLEESEEMPGLKKGSKVSLKGETEVGEIVRLYRSSDGKEKCMVKFGEDKPIKKRVTALELAEEKTSAKKTPSKKK